MIRHGFFPRSRVAAVMAVLLVAALSTACLAHAVTVTASGAQDGRKADQTERVARGRYLARVGDCVSCHTSRGGRPLAGGRSLPTPFGTLYTPNITPDAETGIGDWDRDDFRRAMHEGVDAHGDYLYPGFPFTFYTRVTQRDVDAIWAWLQTTDPVKRQDVEPDLSFPYSWRTLMGPWRAMYFDQGRFEPAPDKSDAYNRGDYLVNGLGHCGACHTDRNWLGATNADAPLEGSMIPEQNWFAPDLSHADGGGLEGWDKKAIIDFLEHGRSAGGIAFGPMADVVHNSTQYLDDSDLDAIATYLLERPAEPKSRSGGGLEPPSRRRQRKQKLAIHKARGKNIYKDHCKDCHGRDGTGKADIYPTLAGNTSILSQTGVNAIRKVLLGGFAPATQDYPRPYSMPPFLHDLSDEEVADVVIYIRHAWGNEPDTDKKDERIRKKDVAAYRSTFTGND